MKTNTKLIKRTGRGIIAVDKTVVPVNDFNMKVYSSKLAHNEKVQAMIYGKHMTEQEKRNYLLTIK